MPPSCPPRAARLLLLGLLFAPLNTHPRFMYPARRIDCSPQTCLLSSPDSLPYPPFPMPHAFLSLFLSCTPCPRRTRPFRAECGFFFSAACSSAVSAPSFSWSDQKTFYLWLFCLSSAGYICTHEGEFSAPQTREICKDTKFECSLQTHFFSCVTKYQVLKIKKFFIFSKNFLLFFFTFSQRCCILLA